MENKPFTISSLKYFGFWATTPFERSEMGLERIIRACEDHEEVQIIIDESFPGGVNKLHENLIKQGASKVTFRSTIG